MYFYAINDRFLVTTLFYALIYQVNKHLNANINAERLLRHIGADRTNIPSPAPRLLLLFFSSVPTGLKTIPGEKLKMHHFSFSEKTTLTNLDR